MFSVGDRVEVMKLKLSKGIVEAFPAPGTIVKDDGPDAVFGRFSVKFDQTGWHTNPTKWSACNLQLIIDEPIEPEDWS